MRIRFTLYCEPHTRYLLPIKRQALDQEPLSNYQAHQLPGMTGRWGSLLLYKENRQMAVLILIRAGIVAS